MGDVWGCPKAYAENPGIWPAPSLSPGQRVRLRPTMAPAPEVGSACQSEHSRPGTPWLIAEHRRPVVAAQDPPGTYHPSRAPKRSQAQPGPSNTPP